MLLWCLAVFIESDSMSNYEIEGYSIYEQRRAWCRLILNKEITFDEYIFLIKKKLGLGAET